MVPRAPVRSFVAGSARLGRCRKGQGRRSLRKGCKCRTGREGSRTEIRRAPAIFEREGGHRLPGRHDPKRRVGRHPAVGQGEDRGGPGDPAAAPAGSRGSGAGQGNRPGTQPILRPDGERPEPDAPGRRCLPGRPAILHRASDLLPFRAGHAVLQPFGKRRLHPAGPAELRPVGEPARTGLPESERRDPRRRRASENGKPGRRCDGGASRDRTAATIRGYRSLSSEGRKPPEGSVALPTGSRSYFGDPRVLRKRHAFPEG